MKVFIFGGIYFEMQVKNIIDSGGIPFVVGGGNDESFPNVTGLVQSKLEGFVSKPVLSHSKFYWCCEY